MSAKTIGSLLAVPLMVAGVTAGPAGATHAMHPDFALTSEALVMIPAMNQYWLDLSKDRYLIPNGFPEDGTATFLQVPQTYDLNASLRGATEILVAAIQNRWDAGTFDAEDPLYVFGYSQASVVAGQAQLQLAEYGIPTEALHFVLVGNSAAEGGFLTGFMETLLSWVPEPWRDDVADLAAEIFRMLRVDEAMGQLTPNDLYPTDVYALTSDGWSNWAGGANMFGMFSDHLAYLGLSPEEVAGATLNPDIGSDLTRYFMIDTWDVNMFQALMNSAQMIMGGLLELL
ncbi:PE-PPE domain-containing protein [Mycolicibacter longobardus]|uniref:PE-PPE domain-containing protein n=1 Tax=Mycolicibacter longobardus TaxID=1108812 RepID=A0A1X1YEL7_9MYCO|nr:PE-PPE domain-containing protein [Mycolicibacter longobardus]ORW09484.1 PE-PPE domain-containing protein [Mycolicibacter longobardus]